MPIPHLSCKFMDTKTEIYYTKLIAMQLNAQHLPHITTT